MSVLTTFDLDKEQKQQPFDFAGDAPVLSNLTWIKETTRDPSARRFSHAEAIPQKRVNSSLEGSLPRCGHHELCGRGFSLLPVVDLLSPTGCPEAYPMRNNKETAMYRLNLQVLRLHCYMLHTA